MILVFTFVAVAVSIAVHILSIAVGGRLVGARIEEIKLFSGPLIFRIRFGNTCFSLHAVPLGGSVKFQDGLEGIHPMKQMTTALCGSLGVLILAMFALGVSDAVGKFLAGFSQIITGAFAPASDGTAFVSAAYEFLKDNPFVSSVGSVASKFAAGNLLPIPTLNGGDAALYLFKWVVPISSKTEERIRLVGPIIVLAIAISGAVAVYSFIICMSC